MCSKNGMLMHIVITIRLIRYAISRSQNAVQCVSISRFDDRAIALASRIGSRTYNYNYIHECRVLTRVSWHAWIILWTERVLLMSSTSCACTITTSIITVAGNIPPLFSLFLSLHAPGCRRCGYLETVRDLSGSGTGN